jgi:hypothetical protein
MSSHGFESHPFRRLSLRFSAISDISPKCIGNITGLAVLMLVPRFTRWRNGNFFEGRPFIRAALFRLHRDYAVRNACVIG